MTTQTTTMKDIINNDQHVPQVIAPEVKEALPGAFIEYLWALALVRADPTSSLQVFVLRPNDIGGREFQEILHKYKVKTDPQQYRIFGVEPINEKVVIRYDGACHEMCLAS